MDADNFVINQRNQGHHIKHIVDYIVNGIIFLGILIKLNLALLKKSEAIVDESVFVVAPQQVELVGKLNF